MSSRLPSARRISGDTRHRTSEDHRRDQIQPVDRARDVNDIEVDDADDSEFDDSEESDNANIDSSAALIDDIMASKQSLTAT